MCLERVTQPVVFLWKGVVRLRINCFLRGGGGRGWPQWSLGCCAVNRLVADGRSEQPVGNAQSRFHLKICQMTLNHSKFNAVYNQINSAHVYSCLLKAL